MESVRTGRTAYQRDRHVAVAHHLPAHADAIPPTITRQHHRKTCLLGRIGLDQGVACGAQQGLSQYSNRQNQHNKEE